MVTNNDNMVQFPLRLPRTLVDWLKKEGNLHKVPPSTFVRRLIRREAGDLPADALLWQQELSSSQIAWAKRHPCQLSFLKDKSLTKPVVLSERQILNEVKE